MAKKADKVRKPGPIPTDPIDLTGLKELIKELGVTFEGAVRGYRIPPEDGRSVYNAAVAWWRETGAVPYNAAQTLAHRAYWEMMDE